MCNTNVKCKEDPSKCGYSINCSSFEDYENGEPTHFIGGLECPYSSFKKINAVDVGHTDEKIETTEFPKWASVYDKEPIVRR